MADIRSLLRTAFGKFRQTVTPELEKIARQSLLDTRNYIITRILEHPVSIELQNHTEPSKYFKLPIGTLFGFMGFPEGSDPVDDLVNFIQRNLDYQINRQFAGKATRFIFGRQVFGLKASLTLPSKELMRKELVELPYGDGRSWPERLESGVEGLPHFLSKRGYGRSQEGFQVDHVLRDLQEIGEIPYLSKIFEGARKKFSEAMRRNSRKL